MHKILALIGLLSILSLLGCTSGQTPADISKLERVTQTLVAPPSLPVHQQVAQGDPKLSRSAWRSKKS